MHNTFIYPAAILELKSILKKLNIESVFFVTGKNSYEKSGAKKIIDKYINEYNVAYYNDFEVNPNLYDVKKGVELFNQNRGEVIVAVGGGSVIDMAKLINYYYNTDVKNINHNNVNNKEFNPKTLVCLPTTAGSGSEATHFAVMYIGDKKFSIADQLLIPPYVIIDPKLHYSQTTYQKAVSGVDALAQSIESFWSIYSTEESRYYSESALNFIWAYLPQVVNNDDEIAHLMVAVGAHLAGKAINIAKTTAPHAFSYGLTKKLGLPHGHAVALLLPFFMVYHKNLSFKNCNDNRGKFHVHNIMEKIMHIINAMPNNLEQTILDFYDKIGISLFNDLKIKPEEILSAMRKVNYDRLKNNPGKVDSEIIQQLFKYYKNLTT